MTVDNSSLIPPFEDLPSWLCSRCQKSTLALDSKPLVKEPKWSRDAREHSAWELEWIIERFVSTMICSNLDCGEIYFVSGYRTHCYTQISWDDAEHEISHWPEAITPGVSLFRIPDECPKLVKKELKRAFKLYWPDEEACANRLRVAVEELLTHQKIPKTVTIKGKRSILYLHSRIDKFRVKNKEAADLLMAIKWLGNNSSHASRDKLNRKEVLEGFELIEHVIELLYVKKSQKLKSLAKKITARKGKPKKK